MVSISWYMGYLNGWWGGCWIALQFRLSRTPSGDFGLQLSAADLLAPLQSSKRNSHRVKVPKHDGSRCQRPHGIWDLVPGYLEPLGFSTKKHISHGQTPVYTAYSSPFLKIPYSLYMVVSINGGVPKSTQRYETPKWALKFFWRQPESPYKELLPRLT